MTDPPALPTGWTLRPMGYGDAQAVAAALNDSVRMFGRGDLFSAEEFRGMLQMPSIDPGRDGRLLVDPSGAVVGVVASLMSEPWRTVQVVAGVGVHPDRPALLALVVDTGVDLALARPEPVPGAVVEVNAPEEDVLLRGVLEEAGFAAVRTSAEMLRDLDDLSDAPVRLPDGVVLQPLDATDVALLAELAELQREAFTDHDGDYVMTPDDFVTFIREIPTVRPDLSVVVTESGTPVGLAVSIADVSDPTGRTGYVASVAVARRARGRGVASAMLAECFRSFRAEGWSTARLHVQEGNRTGADRLYRAVGMRPRFVDITYEKPLR